MLYVFFPTWIFVFLNKQGFAFYFTIRIKWQNSQQILTVLIFCLNQRRYLLPLKVNIWNMSRPLLAVNDSAVMAEYTRNHESPSALFTFKGHKVEGYGLAWSPFPGSSGHLATGDNNGAIYIWQTRVSSAFMYAFLWTKYCSIDVVPISLVIFTIGYFDPVRNPFSPYRRVGFPASRIKCDGTKSISSETRR